MRKEKDYLVLMSVNACCRPENYENQEKNNISI